MPDGRRVQNGKNDRGRKILNDFKWGRQEDNHNTALNLVHKVGPKGE
jgi:hypothetical protein